MAERYVQSWVWALCTFHWFPNLFSPKSMKVSTNQILFTEPKSTLLFWMKKEVLIPKENSNITYNPLSYDGNPDFKKSYWKRRDNALNSFTEGDENLNEHYYIAGFAEKFDYEEQKILGLNTPYVNFVINKGNE